MCGPHSTLPARSSKEDPASSSVAHAKFSGKRPRSVTAKTDETPPCPPLTPKEGPARPQTTGLQIFQENATSFPATARDPALLRKKRIRRRNSGDPPAAKEKNGDEINEINEQRGPLTERESPRNLGARQKEAGASPRA
jgi:hypothetical protein